jgi:CO/xanthine dehydrogenase FAD-binding subunit
MMGFAYHRPQNLQETLELLAEYGKRARILAGGTDLLIYLRSGRGMEEVENVIDITYLEELDFIQEDGDKLCIGALTTHTQLVESGLVNQYAGLLASACAAVGSPQVRNRGTIGGNIANAAVCADTIAPLVALDACVKLERTGSCRWLTLENFVIGPNRTKMEWDEMLTEITFAKLPEHANWGFVRLARREALAIARLNVAVVVENDAQGKVSYISIAPGSVLPSPARINEAEQILLGKAPDDALIRRAGEAVAEKMISISGRRWSTDYKEPVIIALVERAIKQALGVDWK